MTPGTVLFRMNVGRSANADPRWIIPVICRRGGITKREIGEIRILERETRFEIAGDAADHFIEHAARPDSKDPGIRIAPLDSLPERHGHPAGAQPKARGKGHAASRLARGKNNPGKNKKKEKRRKVRLAP